MPKTPRTLIVTKMKNEGPFILEWLAYHLSIGIEDYLIYSNDCNDGTDTLLKLLDKKGFITYRENPFKKMGKSVHMGVYLGALKEKIYRKADWIITTDVDEYINIHVGDGSISALYDAVPRANFISITWRLFGNSNVHEFSDKPVISQFTKCASEYIPRPMKAWCFKTLFKNNKIFRRMDTHRPKRVDEERIDEIHWVNGSGTKLPNHPKLIKNQRRSTAYSYGYDLVTINHYAVRSAESFVVKSDRGDAVEALAIGENYWFNLNNNTEEDKRIFDRIPAMQKVLDDLLSDPDIKAQHTASVDAHRAEIDRLKSVEPYATLYRDITSPRMERLSELHKHFNQSVYQPEGFAKIPADFTDRNYPENHVFSALESEHHPDEDVALFTLDPFYEPAVRNNWKKLD